MMKSMKFTLAISTLFALCATLEARACWDTWYEPRGYRMYRVWADKGTEGYVSPVLTNNCEVWQRETSAEIPLADIRDMVYEMPLADYTRYYNTKFYWGGNRFARWIKAHRRQDILDFLLLAKTNEEIRLRLNSRWYYPTMRTVSITSLEDVAERALAQRHSRLGDRYMLQAMRALFTLARYDECIALWENDIKRLPADNPICRMSEDYVAGAMAAVGRTQEAAEYFARKGDIESIMMCTKDYRKSMDEIDAIAYIYRYCPDSPCIARSLQEYICRIEPSGNEFYEKNEPLPEKMCDKLRRLSLQIAKEGRSANPAMWYYTAAFMTELLGNAGEASRILALAETAEGTELVKNSVRVMRIYLDAKLLPIDNAYEQRLYGQLRWLDGKVVENLTDKVRKITTEEPYRLLGNESYYYWNDMLRRILLSEVCPRMVRAGRHILAMQLANMADNRLLMLVGNREFDYRNNFFVMIDSLGVNRAIAYRNRVVQPQGAFDRFLNERGYTDHDYLCDIVGTQCLRSMRYAEAERYLGEIANPCFNEELNVTPYYRYNPFAIKARAAKPAPNFRYRFAREMHRLEQRIVIATNPDTKAKDMLRFAMGLRNSFGKSWCLTQYHNGYKGGSFWGMDARDWAVEQECREAIDRSDRMIAEACGMVTDADFAAEVQYELCNFRTVAIRYPTAKVAATVRGGCDRLVDYRPHLAPRRYPPPIRRQLLGNQVAVFYWRKCYIRTDI